MVIDCSLLVPKSLALTLTIPLASISKVTSICGTPRGAGGIFVNWKFPKVLLSLAMLLSPCNTWISTAGWLSAAVENTWLLLVGIVVFLGIRTVITPPNVSIPSDNGVTSSKTMSFTSPVNTPPWIAAPMATTSSGFTSFEGSLPNSFLTNSWTQGILVDPPTNRTLSISFLVNLASFIAFLTGSSVESTKSLIKSSNFAFVKFIFKWIGPSSLWVINGNDISVEDIPLRSFLAFSAASFTLCIAILSLDKSIPFSFLNSFTIQSIILSSKSSPPSLLFPLVDLTSKTPSPSSRIETSNVPPPRSYTRTVWVLSCLSSPYARAAAVGSLIILSTSNPAILPAFLVAWRWASLKYAGTVITARVTFSPRYASAVFFKSLKIIADISSGV